jgi:hypothetical protein
MNVLERGAPNQFPKGVSVEPTTDGAFRVRLSAGFAELSCEFTAGELAEVVHEITNALRGVTTRELSEARKEDIDIEEEFDRA